MTKLLVTLEILCSIGINESSALYDQCHRFPERSLSLHLSLSVFLSVSLSPRLPSFPMSTSLKTQK